LEKAIRPVDYGTETLPIPPFGSTGRAQNSASPFTAERERASSKLPTSNVYQMGYLEVGTRRLRQFHTL
jgi:hypothetical protein